MNDNINKEVFMRYVLPSVCGFLGAMIVVLWGIYPVAVVNTFIIIMLYVVAPGLVIYVVIKLAMHMRIDTTNRTRTHKGTADDLGLEWDLEHEEEEPKASDTRRRIAFINRTHRKG